MSHNSRKNNVGLVNKVPLKFANNIIKRRYSFKPCLKGHLFLATLRLSNFSHIFLQKCIKYMYMTALKAFSFYRCMNSILSNNFVITF